MRPEGREAVLEEVSRVLQESGQVKLGLVYGSAARNQLGPHSDIDVAVGAGRPLEWNILSQLHRALSDALEREVDLIDLERLEGLLWEILWTEGKVVLWDHDLVVKYAAKAQAFVEDDKPGLMKMIDVRLEKAFGPV